MGKRGGRKVPNDLWVDGAGIVRQKRTVASNGQDVGWGSDVSGHGWCCVNMNLSSRATRYRF